MKGGEGAGRAGAREVWAGRGRARQPLIEGAETFGLRCRRGSARAPTWPGRRSGNDGRVMSCACLSVISLPCRRTGRPRPVRGGQQA